MERTRMEEGASLKPEDAGGVWPLLYIASGYAAQQRGSSRIEPRDLVKAIYLVDLEHVSAFWNDWQGLEKFVAGRPGEYTNRIIFLVRIELTAREARNSATLLGSPSHTFHGIVAAARKLASERLGSPSTPSSPDLLFALCSQDEALSAALQESGLQLDKLTAAVRKG